MNHTQHSNNAGGSWLESRYVCALTDGERHLGHVVKVDGFWHAYDATCSNDASTGIKYLGSFPAIAAAKNVVSESIARLSAVKVMHAGSGFAV